MSNRTVKDVRTEKYERRVRRHGVQPLSNPPAYIIERKRYMDGHSRTKWGCEYDSQRQKLYRAQRNCPRGNRYETVEEMQEVVDKLLDSAWWKRRWPEKKRIRVKDGRGRRRAGADAHGRWIAMPRYQRTQRTLLHEVAHTVVRAPHAWHGRLYCKVYLVLVRHHMGEDAYEALLEGYREENVRYHPHRTAQV